MDEQTRNAFNAAEESVSRLVEACGKPGPLYQRNPKAVAQVSRTGKWLLNAIAALHRELKKPTVPEDQASA